MRRSACLAVAITAVIATLPAGAASQGSSPPPDNPCLRPELELRCPNLVVRHPSELRLVRTRGGRALLTSRNRIVNVGDGPLELRGTQVREYHMAVRQVLRARSTGRDRVVRGTARIDYYDTGGRGVYWKFRHAAAFELWRLDALGTPVGRVRIGPKLHYCFRDLRRVRHLDGRGSYTDSPRRRRFGACSQSEDERHVVLGTSVGWADIYPARYPDNWISVGGLRGCFAYVHRVDPLGLLLESREDDNVSARTVSLPWRDSRLHGCPHVRLNALP